MVKQLDGLWARKLSCVNLNKGPQQGHWEGRSVYLTPVEKYLRGFPGGPVVKNLCFFCRVHRFDPWSGNKDPICCAAQQQQQPQSPSFWNTAVQSIFRVCSVQERARTLCSLKNSFTHIASFNHLNNSICHIRQALCFPTLKQNKLGKILSIELAPRYYSVTTLFSFCL